MEDLISIIVPVFNIEKYIRRCLDSIIKQSYINFEVILIDDGSTDSSPNICDQYAKMDSRILVSHIENSGPSRARNIGIEMSKGNYLTFIDGDDWIHKDYLYTLYNYLIKYNADLTMINYVKSYDDTPKTHFEQNINYETLLLTNIDTLKMFFGKYNHYLVTVWGKLYKRELFNTINFDEGRLHEDVFILYKLFYAANRIVISTIPLYFYWKREESITGTFYISRQIDHLDALSARAEFFHDIGLIELYRTQITLLLKQYIRLAKYYDINIENSSKNDIDRIYLNLSKMIDNQNVEFFPKMFNQIYMKNPKIINKFLYRYGQFLNVVKRAV